MMARTIFQIVFLSIFIGSLILGSIRLWVVVFVAGVIVSLMFSRIYCGWVCPIGTLFIPIRWIYQSLGLKRVKPPSIKRRLPLAISVMVAFFIGMFTLTNNSIGISALPLVLLVGVGVTLFFEEELSHKYLCPFGAILWMTSRVSKRTMHYEGGCKGCERCVRVCPNGAISIGGGGADIEGPDCLMCFRCQEICPSGSFRYGPVNRRDHDISPRLE
jgi:polyferredoxin